MSGYKKWLACPLIVLCGGISASAFTTNDAYTLFDAYHTAFYATNGGNAYYKMDNGSGTNAGWWTFAEQIEMAEDAYDSLPTAGKQTIVSNLCNGFTSKNGTLWTGNSFNDDISWAVIAFARAYLITGSTTFRNIAKNNFDAMYSRAWDTTFTGGGL